MKYRDFIIFVASTEGKKTPTAKQLKGEEILMQKGDITVYKNGFILVTEKTEYIDYTDGDEIRITRTNSTVFGIDQYKTLNYEMSGSNEEATEGTQINGCVTHYIKDSAGYKALVEIPVSEFLDLDWDKAVTIIADERFRHNEESRFQSHVIYSINGQEANVDFEAELQKHMEDMAQKNADYERLYAAMDHLSKVQKDVIYLYYFKNKTEKEIGHILGKRQSTVSENMSTAKKVLKKFF